ncbi:MAG: twin-arginine translocation signal domain-containing protein [Pseudomonadota bacterium]
MNDTKGASRRDFLKLTGASVPAAAVAVTATVAPAVAAEDAEAAGLRHTDHVKKYLDSARF